MADPTTRMKILLSPAWDHNFFLGPARWTSGYPKGHSDLGGQDNYHPRTTAALLVPEIDNAESWWPNEAIDINDPAGRRCWDADQRIVSANAFVHGTGDTGAGTITNLFTSIASEARETKNRFRGTGTPTTMFDMDELTYINKTTKEQQDSDSNAFEVKRSWPSHYQDYVHDAILQNSDPSDTTSALYKIYPNKPGTTEVGSYPGGYGVFQSTKGSQYSKHWVEGVAAGGAISPYAYYHQPLGSKITDPEPYTYAYEYTLNVEAVTHTWNTLSALVPLPGSMVVGPDTAQINQLGIDVGAMREIITVKGFLYDGPKYSDMSSGHTDSAASVRGDPYAAPNETPIRKQQLLDIVRSQWAPLGPMVDGTSGIGNPNRYPALTLGPMHTSNPNGDQGQTFNDSPARAVDGSFPPAGNKKYRNDGGADTKIQLKSLDMWRYGEEPSDDIRGSNLFCDDESAEFISEVWDYKFNYKGRRRYRGLLIRVSVDIRGGSPDVWDFSFDFIVFKNETTYRKPNMIVAANG